MLWDAGVRDFALDVVSAWKEVLLALALGAIVWRRRGIPFKATSTDWLALVYTAFVVLYALIPQDWLGGEASARGVLYGLRHDLTPVAAYFLGRGITLSHRERERLGWAILGVAAVVAAWGLVDIYTISLQTWRDSGVPGWFSEQLGLDYSNGPLRPARELGLQPRRRAAAAPARLDLPQPARDRVPASRRDPASRRPGAAAAGFPRSRRSSPSACSSRTRARRSRRSWSGSPCSRTPSARGGRSPRQRSSSRPRSSSSAPIPTSRPRRGSRRPSSRSSGPEARRRRRAATRSIRASRRSKAISTACATGSKRSSSTRTATGSATRG